jgi:hypothetical protein
VKRIEKKRLIAHPAATNPVSFIVTTEQVLVDGAPMVKVTVDYSYNSGRPELFGNSFVTIKNGATTVHANLSANTSTVPNDNPDTWQDYFGWWYANGKPQDAEVEDLPVEV